MGWEGGWRRVLSKRRTKVKTSFYGVCVRKVFRIAHSGGKSVTLDFLIFFGGNTFDRFL